MQDSQFSSTAVFSDAYKLSRADGFSHVFKAENIANDHFKIFFVRTCGKNSRLGIVVSKKTLPTAVDRNFVKRFIRESFRRHHIKFSKLDLVVMVKRNYSRNCQKQTESLDLLFEQLLNKCANF